jgi:DNA-directed RNA polymerase specialized sigma subunit
LLSFGAYARYWIRGEITSLFKQQARNPLAKAEPIEQWSERQKHECDERVAAPDLTELTPKERTVIEGRSCDQSLGAIGKDLGISAERVRQIQNKAQTKLRKTKENYPLRIPPRDHEARRFRDEYLACKGNASALSRRRGYRQPSRELLPFRSITYPCRTFSKAEIEAYERGEL